MNIQDKKQTENRAVSSSLPNIGIAHYHNHGEDQLVKSKSIPFVIAVAGGTASGKTSVCDIIVRDLGLDQSRVAIISQDCFYKPLSKADQLNVKEYNFDHPNAFDFDLIDETFKDLHEGKAIKVPIYDYVTHSRRPEATSLCAIDVILFEGILVFYQSRLMKYFNIKIFVDTDADIRLARRILRDMASRGRDLQSVLQQYQNFVKPAFDDYILPTMKNADVIIPRGADNVVAIDILLQHIKTKLAEKARKPAFMSNPSRPVDNNNGTAVAEAFVLQPISEVPSLEEQFVFDEFQ